jgi:tRNA A37 threonylcarbamoyladenosine biosynthesis protein TsaE
VTVVEWADKLLPLLPAARTTRVHLSGLGDEPREIRIEEPVSDPAR